MNVLSGIELIQVKLLRFEIEHELEIKSESSTQSIYDILFSKKIKKLTLPIGLRFYDLKEAAEMQVNLIKGKRFPTMALDWRDFHFDSELEYSFHPEMDQLSPTAVN